MKKSKLIQSISSFTSARMLGRVGRVLVASLSLVAVSVFAVDKPAALTPEQKAAHLERMHKIARSIAVFEGTGPDKRTAELVKQPVLGYRDDTRRQHDSTMWIWGNSGRPTAIIAVEYYPERPQDSKWLYEIASLSAGRIAADRGEVLHWEARKPGLDLTVLTDAPAPAEKPAGRLAQMRQLMRRFTAHERTATEGRIELAPKSAPLHRYQDPKKGILDGAIFAFANGTNPEILWIIEAHAKPGESPTWQFGLAQMTGGEVYVNLGDKEVWTRGEADPPAERDSYINGWMSDASPDK